MLNKICLHCGNPFKARGDYNRYCSIPCANRGLVKIKDPTERFWSHVKKQADEKCWLWTGYRNVQGYGSLFLNHRTVRSHRYSYELTFGKIPEGMDVLHRCDNTSCVNPHHLYVGTDAENALDCVNRNRLPTKLARIQIDEIRRLAKHGLTCREIASRFHVSNSLISMILNHRRWKHYQVTAMA